MSRELLQTKLTPPRLRPAFVPRPRLINQLNAGITHGRTLTLISAPAGFGKTTLVTEWMADRPRPCAWLSLDAGDGDPGHFLTYLVAAVQRVAPDVGTALLPMLQSPQAPDAHAVLTALLNDLAAHPDPLLLVLDDYHLVDAQPVDDALAFLLEQAPEQVHFIITTREDPGLPLARLRARGQLTELRAVDLRFTAVEAATFLNQTMGLDLSADDVAALEQRTEGWIAGLQLAALALQRPLTTPTRTADFIHSFTGSNRFVLDYLVEEVLNQQPPEVQSFLLRTSILERLCGPLCDAVLGSPATTGQKTLAYLEQANLFLIPLDNERRWYRYHHLFAELLQQRLQQQERDRLHIYHLRASDWFEAHATAVEAFQHAAAANDIARAERLINGAGTPLYLRGEVARVRRWLQSLPPATLDERPTLSVMTAWVLWISHRSSQVAQPLARAEAALPTVASAAARSALTGQIAAMRAMLASNEYRTDEILAQSRIALDHLPPDDVAVRTAVSRARAIAYHFQGERAAAIEAYQETIALCEASGNVFMYILSATGLGMVQALQLQLPDATQTFEQVLEMVGDPPRPVACAALLGLARIQYAWDAVDTAVALADQGIHLAQQIEGVDTELGGRVFRCQLQVARGELDAAADALAGLAREARQHAYTRQIPKIVALQVRILLQQGQIDAAQRLLHGQDLPLSTARVLLANGDAGGATAVVTPYLEQMLANRWRDEQLNAHILLALAHHAADNLPQALDALSEAVAMATPGRLVRPFVDEGAPMANLLTEAASRGIAPTDIPHLLAAFATPASLPTAVPQPLVEPLTGRELDVLRLVADGLSNREIGARLYLALSTVKGHNRNIYSKLGVQRRTEAVARARELGLL